MTISQPRLLIPTLRTAPNSRESELMAKILVSSLGRSLFTGNICMLRNHDNPLFRIERRDVDEMMVRSGLFSGDVPLGLDLNCESLAACVGPLNPEPRQWVIVADPASLALRNIDHLIPADHPNSYPPPEVDFYWAANDHCETASRGIWAVRGQYLPVVLERWKRVSTDSFLNGTRRDDAWTEMIHELPLRKKRFEKGEVVSPAVGSFDWRLVSSAAFVTVQGWPSDEKLKFLQALYFGAYFGDESGIMINILDP